MTWCCASFRMLICHLCDDVCEVSVQICPHFKIGLFSSCWVFTVLCIFWILVLLLLLLFYLFIRESASTSRESSSGRGRSRLSAGQGAWCEAQSPGPRDPDLSRRQTVSWLSRPGAPWILVLYQICVLQRLCSVFSSVNSGCHRARVFNFHGVQFTNFFFHGSSCFWCCI